MIDRKHYQAAMDVQSAVNLSGVVFSFAEIMKVICEEQQRLGVGTEFKNHHPICRLFAEQIMHLAGEATNGPTYTEAHREVQRMSEVEEPAIPLRSRIGFRRWLVTWRAQAGGLAEFAQDWLLDEQFPHDVTLEELVQRLRAVGVDTASLDALESAWKEAI